MKVGLVVDGESEYRSLPALLPKIRSPFEILARPLVVRANGAAPVGHLVKEIGTRLTILHSRGARGAIVLLDREQSSRCAGSLALSIQSALAVHCGPRKSMEWIQVVVKDRMYENWLIADARAVQSLKGRFRLNSGFAKQLANVGADKIAALDVLQRAAIGPSYDKCGDALKICGRAEPENMAYTSRSFRRLLRVLKVRAYAKQSARPVQAA